MCEPGLNSSEKSVDSRAVMEEFYAKGEVSEKTSRPDDDDPLADGPAGSRSRGVQSVEIGIKLLVALARGGGPMSLRDLSAAASMSPAKVHRYMVSLMESGMVDHQRSGSYDLGALAREIGMAALVRVEEVSRASEKLPELVERSNAAGVLTVWTDLGAMVVRWERQRAPLSTIMSVGSQMPVVDSATGRAFVGHLPDHVVLPVLMAEAPHMTHDLAAMRAQDNDGTIYRNDETMLPGYFSLARPLLDYHGRAMAVVTLISNRRSLIIRDGPVERMLREF
ncbi:helix-turn-helix domain-containing protein [Acuticoccus sp. MNP-M23]|uniref:IclR family transcriptional regulator n=1 Tax=Acuticoccus sp. MNP-M23 TaxID=3072793 RepID=UPI0028166109|nr:helix-turn-helix domain-containing protein [Acuticoccus sp. MNP-M23]WMS42533.1 helix-turn-helix domain-containing protein [Acuticoccus sp. MNP-M23]